MLLISNEHWLSVAVVVDYILLSFINDTNNMCTFMSTSCVAQTIVSGAGFSVYTQVSVCIIFFSIVQLDVL